MSTKFLLGVLILIACCSAQTKPRHVYPRKQSRVVWEWDWTGRNKVHYECPKGYVIYWPEVNVISGSPAEELPPNGTLTDYPSCLSWNVVRTWGRATEKERSRK